MTEIVAEPPMQRVSDDGIDRPVRGMMTTVSEEAIFHSGVGSPDRIRRAQNEKLHSYCARYARAERCLK